MASGEVAGDVFTGLILKEVKETGVEFGVGAYGRVFAVDYYGIECAAKEIHPILLYEVGKEEFKQTRDNFLKECQRCAELRHPNIVQFLGIYYKPESPVPVLVMEKMDESLRSALEHHQNMPMTIKLSILLDVSLGLRYLHSHKIVHGDLSSNNILLTLLRAKISDLGVPKVVRTDHKKSLTKIPGTVDFMPPEAQQDVLMCGPSLDVFSYGGIMIHTATQLWPTPSAMKQYDPQTRKDRGFTEVERRQSYINQMTGEAKDLVPLAVLCLDDDPAARPPINDVSESIKKLKEKSPDLNMNPMLLLQQKTQLEDQQNRETVQQKQEINLQKAEIEQLKWEVGHHKRENNLLKNEIEDYKRQFEQKGKEGKKQKLKTKKPKKGKDIHDQQSTKQPQPKSSDKLKYADLEDLPIIGTARAPSVDPTKVSYSEVEVYKLQYADIDFSSTARAPSVVPTKVQYAELKGPKLQYADLQQFSSTARAPSVDPTKVSYSEVMEHKPLSYAEIQHDKKAGKKPIRGAPPVEYKEVWQQ